MCFARTAALQGGDKRQKVKASFMQHLQHNVQKCPKTVSGRAKTGPRGTQDRSRQAQDRSRQAKTGPRQVKTGQDRPKTGPRQAQDRPRQAQDSPKQTQDRFQAGQDKPRQRFLAVLNDAKPKFFLWFPLMSMILMQKRNKSEKRANIMPTWPQHGPGLTSIWKPPGLP